MDSAKPIYKYLKKQNSQVVDLITHGQNLYRLSCALKPIINQCIADNWQLGKFSTQEITLLVNSAELANRLRYQSVNILQEIRKLESCKKLNKINIKVGPLTENKVHEKELDKKSALIPSKIGKQHLKLLAEIGRAHV